MALQKGQRCSIQALNLRLATHHGGDGKTDMALEVVSPSARRVAHSDDTPLFPLDPVVSFVAEESGDYIITARQQTDRFLGF